MIGPIRQELLSGIKESAQFEKVKKALGPFRDEAVETLDYEEAARLFNLCRSYGVECGPVDILFCAVARRRKWDVLTNDAVMKRCLEVTGLAITFSSLDPTHFAYPVLRDIMISKKNEGVGRWVNWWSGT